MQRLEANFNPVKAAITLGGGLFHAAQSATPFDWLIAAGLANTVLMIFNNTIPLYHSFTSRGIPSELELGSIARERESALSYYKSAMDDLSAGSLGSALSHIDMALEEFNRTISTRRTVATLGINRTLHAELIYFRAQIHYFRKQYANAEKDLLAAVKCDHAFIPAHNFLTHLYMNELRNVEKANKHLHASHLLNDDQVLTRFYNSVIKADLHAMDDAAQEILNIYHHKLNAVHQHGAQNNQINTPGWVKLHETTPLIAIPYMLMKWLDFKILHERNPVVLTNILKSIDAILTAQGLSDTKHLEILLKEARIRAFLKISYLKKSAVEFTHADKSLRSEFCISSTDGDNTAHFIEYDSEHIDHALTKLFPLGNATDYLSAEKYQDPMAAVIIEWVKQGWLIEDKHPNIVSIHQKLRRFKHQPENQELLREIFDLCRNEETIKRFLDHYIHGKGWKPWFTVTPVHDSVLSLINFAAQEQGVASTIYGRQNDDVNDIKPIMHLAAAQSNIHPDGNKNNEPLHLLLDADQVQLKILQEISTPSRLYRWVALKSCWDLLKQDPDNKYALSVLEKRGFVLLPKPAALPDQASQKNRFFSSTPSLMAAAALTVGAAGAAYYLHNK